MSMIIKGATVAVLKSTAPGKACNRLLAEVLHAI